MLAFHMKSNMQLTLLKVAKLCR